MKLGESMNFGGWDTLRVPGGWLFSCPGLAVFIPFDNEFQEVVGGDNNVCSFPDCGCAGARLCMVGNPNEAALNLNREHKSKYISPEDKVYLK